MYKKSKYHSHTFTTEDLRTFKYSNVEEALSHENDGYEFTVAIKDIYIFKRLAQLKCRFLLDDRIYSFNLIEHLKNYYNLHHLLVLEEIVKIYIEEFKSGKLVCLIDAQNGNYCITQKPDDNH